jgi:hypothetical protein
MAPVILGTLLAHYSKMGIYHQIVSFNLALQALTNVPHKNMLGTLKTQRLNYQIR